MVNMYVDCYQDNVGPLFYECVDSFFFNDAYSAWTNQRYLSTLSHFVSSQSSSFLIFLILSDLTLLTVPSKKQPGQG